MQLLGPGEKAGLVQDRSAGAAGAWQQISASLPPADAEELTSLSDFPFDCLCLVGSHDRLAFPGLLINSVRTAHRNRKLFRLLDMITVQALQSQVMSQMVPCPSDSSHLRKMLLQAHLGDIAGLAPDHRNKASVTSK